MKTVSTQTQEQADALIAEWQGKIANATENLLALDDTVVLKRIEGRSGFTALMLSGSTAARVTPALAAMRELFDQIGTLSELVEKAVRLRRSLNRLWKYDETLLEIKLLLRGPSIPLPAIHTPLAERSLVSASQNQRARAGHWDSSGSADNGRAGSGRDSSPPARIRGVRCGV